jgi:hypothetical protein
LLPAGVIYNSSSGLYSPTLHAVTWEWAGVVSGFVDAATVLVWVPPMIESGEWVCNDAQFLAFGAAAPYDPQPGNNAGGACTLIEKGLYSLYLPVVAREP